MEQKSLLKNAFYAAIKAFLSLIFPIITFPYATRILGPVGIGKANFSNSIIQYFLLLATLGISSYATREIAKIRNDKIQLSKFVFEILFINFISTLISYTLFILSIIFVPKFQAYKSYMLVYSSLLLLTFLGVEWFYKGIEDFKYITIRTFIVQIISIIYLFVFVRKESDVIHYCVFNILSYAGAHILNFIHIRKFITFKGLHKLELQKHLKPVFLFFGMALISSLYNILDSSMLGFLSTDTEVGYYYAAIKFNKLTVGVLSAVFGILLPRLSYYKQQNDEVKFNEVVKNSININIFLCIPLMVILFSLSEPLTLLFCGNEYYPAILPMRIMSPIIISMGIATLLGEQLLPSIGKEKVCLFSYLCGAIINVTLNAISIPKYGSCGAAFGTLVAETLITLVQFIYLRKYLISKQLLITFIQCPVSALLMFIGSFFIQKLFVLNILKIIVGLLTGGLIYILVLFVFKNKVLIEILNKIKNMFKTKEKQNL